MRHVGPPSEVPSSNAQQRGDPSPGEARRPTRRGQHQPRFRCRGTNSRWARRPTKSDKARHVGHGQLVVPHVRQTGTYRKARRVGPPRAVPISRDSNKFKKPSSRDLARRGTSAHQVKSTQAEAPSCLGSVQRDPQPGGARRPSKGETHRLARHVGPPGEANTGGGTRMDQNWRTAQLRKSCQLSSSCKSRISNPRLS